MAWFSIFPAFVAVVLQHGRGAAAQYGGCTNGTVASIGDGRCDTENNNPYCGFDGGDCCPCTCSDGPVYSCSDSNLDCVYPGCGEPSSATSDISTCVEDLLSDGLCSSDQNTPACGYDGGDCCTCTCSDGPSFTCGLVGYDCQDPTCMDPVLVAEFPDCAGDWLLIGDGSCHDDLNNPFCGYDGGDCCLCSCTGSACTSNYDFDCLDSAAGTELYDCAAPPPSPKVCSENAQERWVVDGSAQAQALAAAINCTGGSFEVEWRGSVVVSQTLFVGDETVLTIDGFDSGAVIDGDSLHRLFTVVNASLHLSNLNISSGASIAGGAIAAAGSTLTFNRTNFEGNRASSHGGAVYVSDRSSVSCVGGGTFAGNEAGYSGGAMFITGESAVSCGGAWFNNRAARNGGGVSVRDFSNMSWSSEAAFMNNTAGHAGGSVVVDGGSHLAWNSTTVFDSNNAAFGGGAILVLLNSSASWSGITTFVNNTAESGGAFAMFGNSKTRWSTPTSFVGNEAADGGAVIVQDSDLSWSGDGTSFYDNRATGVGGGMILLGSSLSGTNSVMSGNSAVSAAGALDAELGSSVVFSGSTLFDSNRAVGEPDVYESGFGGCITIDSSEMSWTGDMQFVNNSAAQMGGVFYMSESRVSWAESTTKFEGNTALSGGALFVWNGSTVSWTSDTEFTSNEAHGDGGAVGSPAFDSEYNFRGSSLVINGSTAFVNNTSHANGGALALVEGLSVVFNPAVDVSFVENTAAVAGGAVFVSGTGVGPQFTDVFFISNSAQVGGAVCSVGSGNLKGFADVESPNPTTFSGCQFIGNRATATGGAIESAAGQDELVDCLFEGNKAMVGGAIRLAGTTSVENCSFVENTSGNGEGSAVSNIGVIAKMANISFMDNFFDCEPGTFLNFSAGHPYEIICSGCITDCRDCYFDDPSVVPTCTSAPDHSSSGGGNTTLATLSIDPGYWRATASSKDILACYTSDACLGGVTGSAGYCSDGYEGPYCSVCSEGYTQELKFACTKCSDDTSGIVVMSLLGAMTLCIGAAVASYLMSGDVENRRGGSVGRLLRNIPLQSVKIIIAAWQILTQFAAVANVTYPDIYQQFLDGLDVFNFDLGWMLSAGCVFELNFHHRLMISTIAPIVALLFLVGTYTVAAAAHGGAHDNMQIIWNKHVSMVLLLTFFVYSSVSSVLFNTFACDKLSDGTNYLRADYRIECDSFKHKVFQVYGGIMIVLYTVGIPAFYGCLLFKDREVLKQDTAQREGIPRVSPTSDLWKPYKPSAFYYEVVECGRRLLLAGVVVFIYPGTAAQIAITLMMSFVFAILSEGVGPYASRWDTWLSRLGHGVVFVSMYVALLLKVDVSDERAGSQKVFEALLVGAHASMVLVMVVETVVLTWSLKAERGKPSAPPLPEKNLAGGQTRAMGKITIFPAILRA